MDKSNKMVSIIVPVYNAEENLRHCLNSILKQTYSNLEIILINDGSTDNSGEICDEFAKKDDRMIVIHQNNAGPSIARNNGIDIAKGEFIQFVDADDLLKIDMTERLVNSMKQDIQLVICGYQSVNENHHIIQQFTPHVTGTLQKSEFLDSFSSFYKQIIIPSIWNKLYIRELIKFNKINFNEDLKLGEDLLFNLKYFKSCLKINLINDVLYSYKVENDQSLSQNYKEDFFNNQCFLEQKVKEFLIDEKAYTDHNKYTLQLINANSLINSFDNLFHKNSHLTKDQKMKEISYITKSRFAAEAHFQTNVQTRLIGFFTKHQLNNFIYMFFNTKNKLKNKMYPVFKMLKTMIRKE